jgi:hypothetical protein
MLGAVGGHVSSPENLFAAPAAAEQTPRRPDLYALLAYFGTLGSVGFVGGALQRLLGSRNWAPSRYTHIIVVAAGLAALVTFVLMQRAFKRAAARAASTRTHGPPTVPSAPGIAARMCLFAPLAATSAFGLGTLALRISMAGSIAIDALGVVCIAGGFVAGIVALASPARRRAGGALVNVVLGLVINGAMTTAALVRSLLP